MPKKNSRSRFALKTPQNGFTHRAFLIVIALIFVFVTLIKPATNNASADSPRMNSAISGYCLDDHKNSLAANNEVDLWKCNNSVAQTWELKSASIVHGSEFCLSVENNSTSSGSAVVLNKCDDQTGQVWLSDQGGYFNPNSGMCLSAPASLSEGQIIIKSCKQILNSVEGWIPQNLDGKTVSDVSCSGSAGNIIACNAEKEWTIWQSGLPNHNILLNNYTDSSPYEEWCADFVSYVYRESGYPFTGGEANGWDESNANNVINMGFTQHMASSGYIPKPGDVAYFNYETGHIEIVIVGGKHPTFVYGNSGTIDPLTGNGEMAANTITNDGSEGQLVYYLSPNVN